MKNALQIGGLFSALAILLAPGAARADEALPHDFHAYTMGVALTIGESVYFVDGDGYRGPVSLEVVPSIGWLWFKFDLGVSVTLESVEIADTHVGDWNVTLRPGGRLTPPATPLYVRVAFPLQIKEHDVDWGVMFGVGADIEIASDLGFVVELDTTLSKNLEWGGRGFPLEFRAGLSLHF